MEEFKQEFINVAYYEFGIKAIESITFEQAFAILDKMQQLRLGNVKQRFTYPKGCLTDSEWQELVTLEYVLTWGYTDDEEKDSKRHRELSDKRWASLNVS